MIAVETILVPLDFSPHSDRALTYAIDLAKRYGARIHLLHCYRSEFAISVYDPPYIPDLPKDFDARVREGAERRLRETRERITGEGIACEQHLEASDPSEAIPQTADRIGAELIVMGTRGLSGLKHVLLGSVAERTVRRAHCPVLMVKQPD